MRLLLIIFLLIGTPGFADETSYAVIERGREIFKRCQNCHTIEEGGYHRIGPNLYGIMGRKIASLPDFDYSPALKEYSGVWTAEVLNSFIERPNHVAMGTDMSFRGINNPSDREALVSFLALQGPGTINIEVEDTLLQALENGDAERGKRLFHPCQACHSFKAGAANKIGPNLYGVVGREIASSPGFGYSEQLVKLSGIWTPERLNSFIFEEKKFRRGTHMAFRPFTELSDRADLIAWLKKLSPDYSETIKR